MKRTPDGMVEQPTRILSTDGMWETVRVELYEAEEDDDDFDDPEEDTEEDTEDDADEEDDSDGDDLTSVPACDATDSPQTFQGATRT